MFSPSRRAFLGASFAGLASGRVPGADKPAQTAVKTLEDPAFQPSTLFLTWQRDPTTTMTVQWVGTVGETADTRVYYSPGALGPWLAQKPLARPYPVTDFKVFRAELTGLAPGTTYQFRIGKSSPTYRFRTMPAKSTDAIHFISGGDCGVNAHTVANNIQAARQDPMFAVIGGGPRHHKRKTLGNNPPVLPHHTPHTIGRARPPLPLVAG